jgi:tyrosyl-tRNA synthetase
MTETAAARSHRFGPFFYSADPERGPARCVDSAFPCPQRCGACDGRGRSTATASFKKARDKYDTPPLHAPGTGAEAAAHREGRNAKMEKSEKESLIDGILRDAVDVCSKESLLARLGGGKALTVKMGADPSRPDLHLGHTVILRRLRLFQALGHEVVFVIGDFTGMIGDPTGRSKTRPALTLEQTRKSGASYFRQVTKILDPGRTKIVYNSEWLDRLRFSDVIRLASHATLAQILAREDFRTRFEGGVPVSLHELLYPLAQGYDSVALGADVEIGGTDQTFNLLLGRSLQAAGGQTPQEIVTYPLLPGLDGKNKMSKSLDNYIGIDEPADRMFEKAMRVPDECLADYCALTTDIGRFEAAALIARGPQEAHFRYAGTVTALYHGQAAARAAEKRYRRVAAGLPPEEMPELQLPGGEAPDGKIGLIDALLRAGFAASRSQARRAVAGHAVRINGEAAEDPLLTLDLSRPVVLRCGKSRYCRISLRGDPSTF